MFTKVYANDVVKQIVHLEICELDFKRKKNEMEKGRNYF